MNKLNEILNKIVTLDEAKRIVEGWKQRGEKIVFTNGCFDIIHKGHVYYLAQAHDLGTKLILGLNTDESIEFFTKYFQSMSENLSRISFINK